MHSVSNERILAELHALGEGEGSIFPPKGKEKAVLRDSCVHSTLTRYTELSFISDHSG